MFYGRRVHNNWTVNIVGHSCTASRWCPFFFFRLLQDCQLIEMYRGKIVTRNRLFAATIACWTHDEIHSTKYLTKNLGSWTLKRWNTGDETEVCHALISFSTLLLWCCRSTSSFHSTWWPDEWHVPGSPHSQRTRQPWKFFHLWSCTLKTPLSDAQPKKKIQINATKYRNVNTVKFIFLTKILTCCHKVEPFVTHSNDLRNAYICAYMTQLEDSFRTLLS